MGLGDKMKNAKDKATGKAKETAGKATDNKRLEAEGKGGQAKADVKDAADNAKDKLTGK